MATEIDVEEIYGSQADFQAYLEARDERRREAKAAVWEHEKEMRKLELEAMCNQLMEVERERMDGLKREQQGQE